MTGNGGSVHATAFLIGETGVLATGGSGSGKSMLAAGLAASSLGPSVRLVADDRVRLSNVGGRLVARPVAGFLGRIELRGFGMAEMAAMPSAVIRCIVRLTSQEPSRIPDQVPETEEFLGLFLPVLKLMEGGDSASRFLTKWPHFRGYLGIG
jgi:HPr kinase/phosphorylase